jgi:hypothetical protein
MDAAQQQRHNSASARLHVLARQQLASGAEQQATEHHANQQQLQLNPTAGSEGGGNASSMEGRMLALMESSEPYAVPLPESLYPDHPWQVYRCGCACAFVCAGVATGGRVQLG